MLPLTGPEVRQRGLDHEERALEVDRVHPVPLLLGDPLEPAELHDARDVGQHVDPAVLGARRDGGVDGRLVADVALDVGDAVGDGRR